MRKLFIFLLFVQALVLPAGGLAFADDGSAEYSKILHKALIASKEYLELAMADENDVAKFKQAVDALNAFALQFPQSEFADDAQVLFVCVCFLDAVFSRERENAQGLIAKMQEIARQYPQASLQEFTRQQTLRLLRHQIAMGFLYIPYAQVVTYMQGWMAWELGDYERAVQEYQKLKDVLDYSNDKGGYVAENVYGTLANAYLKMGQLSNAQTIAQEAVDKFPDQRNLRVIMRELGLLKKARE